MAEAMAAAVDPDNEALLNAMREGHLNEVLQNVIGLSEANRNRMTTTRMMPSARLCSTVVVV